MSPASFAPITARFAPAAKTPPSSACQRDLWNKGGRQGIFSNIDSRAAAGIFIGGDNHGRREAGGSVAQARGEIRGGSVLGGGGMGGHDDSARDVIGDAITVGVFEHPADGEWIGRSRAGVADCGVWKANALATARLTTVESLAASIPFRWGLF